ncbi:hypothetical protein LOM8899_02154 [Flavimaricola marinus]|uniref:Uncharacterized protein n=2 Tax=Flavimaricola marinus TaxID=1819565 RepID=A0A238LEG5_9RHOB|nr:hypothetical protein LOM8899_02154 [Flavimaricola marinus]
MTALAAGLLSVLTSLPAPSTAEEARLVTEPFNESVRPEANTGGARVVGLQFLGGSAEADLHALIPARWADAPHFCVRTNSSDGLYDSVNTYHMPQDLTAPVEVPHLRDSEHDGIITSLHPEGFGIRITRDDCDAVTDDTPNALGLWRDARPGDSFAIFVNSFDADRVVAYPQQGSGVECEPIGADISVAFDQRCVLPLPLDMTQFYVELQPIKNGRRGRIETILIDTR